MTADRCWNVAREGHQADCPVGRAEAAERARVDAAAERLLADVAEHLPGWTVDLTGWSEGELREVYGK